MPVSLGYNCTGRTAIVGLDWSQCPVVESVPGKVSVAWVFRGTRMPVATVFENLEEGMTIDELVAMYDALTREHVKAWTSPLAAWKLRCPPLNLILFDQGTPVAIRHS